MSYTSRHRYKSMREKNQSFWKKVKAGIFVFLIALAIYIFKNRVAIKDYLWTFL